MDFVKIELPETAPSFEDLYHSASFEPTGKGRLGTHLVKRRGDEIPLVRTTTAYSLPAQYFTPLHEDIIRLLQSEIKQIPPLNLPETDFNNALIEVYDKSYTHMKLHSDQALDLDAESCIALYSCYSNPETLSGAVPRKLVIQEKGSEQTFEIPLTHQSVVVFSVETNRRFLHKIVADPQFQSSQPDRQWLGITFRCSKTFIRFQDGVPLFADGSPLTLADASQSKDFFVLRGQENREIRFDYPKLHFTISPGDLMLPIPAKI